MDFSKMCPKYEAGMEVLSKKWTGLIVRVLLAGPKRFKDIKAQIPDMSDRILSERIKDLEQAEIIIRRVYPETPVRIEYELTEKGKGLQDIIEAIQEWSEKWM